MRNDWLQVPYWLVVVCALVVMIIFGWGGYSGMLLVAGIILIAYSVSLTVEWL